MVSSHDAAARAQGNKEDACYAGQGLYRAVEAGVIVRKCQGLIGLSVFWRF